MRYAIVQDGVVTNVIEWDGETPYDPPEGAALVLAADDTTKGDTHNPHTDDFTAAPDPDVIVGIDVSVAAVIDTMVNALPDLDGIAVSDPNQMSVQELVDQVQRLSQYVAKMIRFNKAILENSGVDPNTLSVDAGPVAEPPVGEVTLDG